jgi:hypothetical protein
VPRRVALRCARNSNNRLVAGPLTTRRRHVRATPQQTRMQFMASVRDFEPPKAHPLCEARGAARAVPVAPLWPAF